MYHMHINEISIVTQSLFANTSAGENHLDPPTGEVTAFYGGGGLKPKRAPRPSRHKMAPCVRTEALYVYM